MSAGGVSLKKCTSPPGVLVMRTTDDASAPASTSNRTALGKIRPGMPFLMKT